MSTAATKGKALRCFLAPTLAALLGAGDLQASRSTPASANDLLEKPGVTTLASASHATDTGAAFAPAAVLCVHILIVADTEELAIAAAEQLAGALADALERASASASAEVWAEKLASGGQSWEAGLNFWKLQELDANLQWGQFEYHRARWLDPSVGRFISMDPWQGSAFEPVTLHKYLYAGANPVDWTDPDGQDFSLTSMVMSMGIAGLVNAMFGAVFSNYSPTSSEFWGEFGVNFGVGFVTQPLGGLFTKALAPLARTALRPLLEVLGKMQPLVLSGKAPLERMLVQISRFFINTNKSYPRVNSTALGRTFKMLFPNVEWDMHHWLVKQAFTGKHPLYDSVAANDGLRRVGNGLWNLLPLPRQWHQWIHTAKVGPQLLATAFYSIAVFGPTETLLNFLTDDGP